MRRKMREGVGRGDGEAMGAADRTEDVSRDAIEDDEVEIDPYFFDEGYTVAGSTGTQARSAKE